MSLNELLLSLRKAQLPEDVFGESSDGLKDRYREMAKLAHPDLQKTKANAEEAFKLLNEWNRKAELKVKQGVYGDRSWMEPVTLKTRKRSYTLLRRFSPGDVANVYSAVDGDRGDYAVKICRNPANNDLLDNEREILSYLWADAKTKGLQATAHIVKFHDSFELAVGPTRKRVNVCRLASGYYSLAEVGAAFPNGIDMRDAAWMFNRILGALLVAQQAGVVHNAIIPEHVLIHPGKHNAKLCGWSYATRGRLPAFAYVARRAEFYAPEVLAKKPTTTATDLYMAVKTILSIVHPVTIPRNISGLFKTCLLAQRNRPQDVWSLFEEFGRELVQAYGPNKFRTFTMPALKKYA